jgi:hypothetical protein
MNGLMICVAMTVGIDVGWQNLPKGGMEYIIQLDPQTLESLRSGMAIQSEIPPAAGEIRSYRIMVGTQQLRRETPVATRSAPPLTPASGPTEFLPAAPRSLTVDSHKEPSAEKLAVYEEHKGEAPADQPTKAEVQSSPKGPPKPWFPLTLALLGLFASLGANVYLAWIVWDLRQRYRARMAGG